MRVPEKSRSPRTPRLTVPKPTVADLEKTERQLNRAGTDFLKVDAATALTFSQNALTADDPSKKARNQKSARKAYDTILRMSNKVALTDRDAEELRAALQQLKANLVKLGEVF
jgi:hypothetical protein